MISSLLINNSEYKNYIVDGEANVLRIEAELDVNNPVCSTYEVTLDNSSNIVSALIGDNFPAINRLPVKLYNDGVLVFEGYLNKEDIKQDPRTQNITITANGKEQELSQKLSNFDITQVYYALDAFIPPRQRGGRTRQGRLDSTEYNKIDLMIKYMFNDIGFADSDILIGYDSKDNFRYKYNPEKYGDIATKTPIGKLRNISDQRRGLIDGIYSRRYISQAENDRNSGSYNNFIKDAAAITGCIYFYDYQTGKILFMYRHHALDDPAWYPNGIYNRSLDASQLVLDSGHDIEYMVKYDSIALKFNDATFIIKPKSDVTPEDSDFEYGIEAGNYEVIFANNDYIMQKDGVNYYILGTVEPSYAITPENSLVIEIDAHSSDYIMRSYLDNNGYPVSYYLHLEPFLRKVYENYYNYIKADRAHGLTLNGLYFAPLRVSSTGISATNCFYSETDFNKEETKIKLIY